MTKDKLARINEISRHSFSFIINIIATVLLFDIKRYSINDGPGIRITLFTKGCPLSCVWCHNPEGISAKKELLYTRRKCIGCATCVRVCPEQALRLTKAEGIVCDRAKCTTCNKCVEVCPTLALEMSGTDYTYDQLMAEIEKETPIMDSSGGGVTFCGGEPLLHHADMLAMLRRCSALGIHRAVDTTLYAPWDKVEQIADNCELLLIDLKHMDNRKHQLYCGVSNSLILANLRRVAEAGYPFWIRIPLVGDVNADDENLTRSADFLASLPWQEKRVDLLPYHDIGNMKHEKLATTYNPHNLPMRPPTEEEKTRATEIFTGKGLTAGIGG